VIVEELRYVDGVAVRVRREPSDPAFDVLGCFVLDQKHRAVPGVEAFRDTDGDFVAYAGVVGDAHQMWLPYGAIRHNSLERLICRISMAPKGTRDAFNIDVGLMLPEPGTFSKVGWLAPLVGLAMAVACADGTIDNEEIRVIKNAMRARFQVSSTDEHLLKDLLRLRPPDDIVPLVLSVRDRIPVLAPDWILALLVDVALVPGQPTQEQAAVLEKVALTLGLPPSSINHVKSAAQYSVLNSADLRVLGLESCSDLNQLKSAYRARMKESHPDRFENASHRIRQAALEESREITAAYERLCETAKHFGRDTLRGTRRQKAPDGASKPEAFHIPQERRWARMGFAQATLPWGSQGSSTGAARGTLGDSPDSKNMYLASFQHGGPRVAFAIVGGIIGFVLGLPAGGIGSIPAAMIGAAVGYFFIEVGCIVVVLLVVVVGLVVFVVSSLR